MKESKISGDRRVLLREVFTHESIQKNGGVITGGVTLDNGVATMDNTGTITYSGNKDLANKSKFTLRVKMARRASGSIVNLVFFTNASNRVLILYYLGNVYGIVSTGSSTFGSVADPHNDSETHDICLVFDGSGAANADRLKMYIEGSPQSLTFTGTIPASTTLTGTLDMGIGSGYQSEGSFELVEIYDSALTAEEVSLCCNNKLYKGFIQENCVLFADYMTGSSVNHKDTAGIHTDTNTTYLHNIGVHCDTTTKIEYGAALAITGDWSLETMVDRQGLGDYYPIGVTTADEGLYIDIGSSGDWGFYDGTSALTAESAVTYFNRQHLVVTKSGTSYKFYRAGVLVNTVAGIDLDITQITVGMLGDGTGGMSGNMAYVREYSRVLSAEEVAQNHQYAVDNYGAI